MCVCVCLEACPPLNARPGMLHEPNVASQVHECRGRFSFEVAPLRVLRGKLSLSLSCVLSSQVIKVAFKVISALNSMEEEDEE